MRRLRLVGGVLGATLTISTTTATAGAATHPLQSSSAVAAVGAARTPGVPDGGPDALYAQPPKLAMTTNHDPRFRAPYNLVSGSERYIGGEYEYTGYAYDDHDTTYPGDFGRYANNCANLIEFRVAPYPGGVLYRFTLDALLQKDSTIVTVAFDSDRNASTGSSTLPKDPGLPFPGTDQVLTTWGTGAEWSTWSGSRWRSTPLKLATDLEANQISVEVPDRVARPTGDWRATLATGLYDPASKGWLSIASNSTNASNIVNLGFRFNEDRRLTRGLPEGDTSEAGNTETDAPWEHQTAALKAGRPTAFAHVLHFGWMRERKSWDNIPTHGLFLRMAPSYLKGGTANKGNVPTGWSPVDKLGTSGTKVVHVFRREGKDEGAFETEYYSPLQPYAIYVPEHYVPGTPTRLMFWLHPDMGDYWGLGAGGATALHVFGDARNSIVIDPLARSRTNFFLGEEEQALFEAWNDAARHYTLDATRTVMAGGSGGGFGAYHAGTMWPQLFASVVAIVPGGQRGIYVPGLSDGETVLNNWLPNLRNLPVMHVSDMFSELTFYPGNVQNAIGPKELGNSLEQLKYRYVFRSVAKDHILIYADIPYISSWMGDRQVESRPFHVTYVRQPTNDDAPAGIVHNKAYWLSHIEIRDNSKPVSKGTIDAFSHGFGLADPESDLQVPTTGMDMIGNVWFQIERTWKDPMPAPKQDRLVIFATNIGSATIDPVAAHVSCHVKLDIHSDGPLKVTLLGCPR